MSQKTARWLAYLVVAAVVTGILWLRDIRQEVWKAESMWIERQVRRAEEQILSREMNPGLWATEDTVRPRGGKR